MGLGNFEMGHKPNYQVSENDDPKIPEIIDYEMDLF